MFNNEGFARKTLAVSVGLITCTIASQLSAQDSSDLKLEEVLVTAQKRVEKIQDVPISVASLQGEKLNEAGIENLSDLTVHMPNIHFTETGISTQVRVRGIGSDNSQGFEQSVGTYVDGIYFGRAQLFRAPLMDMERAELLRGPQSTLFGKNSIAGALNLTTARPTDELMGRLTVSQETEFNQLEVNGVLSGPITDNLQARLAVRALEEDGYFYNTYLQEDEGVRDESAVRLSVAWQPSDKLDLFFKAEKDTFDVIGRPIEITQDIPQVAGNPNYAQTLTALSQPTFDAEMNYIRQTDLQDVSDNEITNMTFIGEYDWNDYTITWTTGVLEFDYMETCECDFVAAKIIDLDLQESYEQFSQEIRIASPLGGDIDWIAGIFYQDYEQAFVDELNIEPDSLLVAAIGSGLADTGLRRDFTQDSKAWSAFARLTWHLDDLHVTVGGRFAKETKDASKVLSLFTPSTGAALNDPFVGWLYLNAFLVESEQSTTAFIPPTTPNGTTTVVPLENGGHNVTGSRDESEFLPLVNLQYDFSDDVMGYVSATRGYKAGGFDPRSNSVGNFASTTASTESNPTLFFEFEEESAMAYALGMKSTLADGRAEVNVELYRTDYDDLQISQFDGAVGFNVGNAKDTVVQGLEVDGRWLLNEEFVMSYGISYLDFKYKDFKNGNCYDGQTPNGIDLDGNGSIDTCDYTGKRGVYTPKWTTNLSLDYFHPINADLDLRGFLDVQNVGKQQVHVNLDPTGRIDSYTMVTMRVGVESENWGLAFLGKNLLNEAVVTYSANAPLSGSTFGTNTHYSFLRRPRTFAFEGTLKF